MDAPAHDITYRLGNDIDLDDFIELYHASTLGERRPIENRRAMAAMLAPALQSRRIAFRVRLNYIYRNDTGGFAGLTKLAR